MRIRKILQTFNHYLFYFAILPFTVIAVLTVFDVSGRYFGYPISGTMEITAVCLALIVSFSQTHTQAVKGHISIDLLYKFLPSQAKLAIGVIIAFLSLGIISLMAWRTLPWVMSSFNTKQWISIVQWPLWPFKAAFLFGLICLCLQLLLDLVDSFKKLGKPSYVKTDVISPPAA